MAELLGWATLPDPELRRAMTEAGMAVEEEAVLDHLLADLER